MTEVEILPACGDFSIVVILVNLGPLERRAGIFEYVAVIMSKVELIASGSDLSITAVLVNLGPLTRLAIVDIHVATVMPAVEVVAVGSDLNIVAVLDLRPLKWRAGIFKDIAVIMSEVKFIAVGSDLNVPAIVVDLCPLGGRAGYIRTRRRPDAAGRGYCCSRSATHSANSCRAQARSRLGYRWS